MMEMTKAIAKKKLTALKVNLNLIVSSNPYEFYRSAAGKPQLSMPRNVVNLY